MKKLYLSDLIEDGIEFYDEENEEVVVLVRKVSILLDNVKIIEDVNVENWYCIGSDLYIIL